MRNFIISLSQEFRIWMSDGFERLVHQNIHRQDSNRVLIGFGIHYAILDASRATETVVLDGDRFDPFLIGSATASICEEVARAYGEEVKVASGPPLILGARFAAAIFGLRALIDADSLRIATRARRSIGAKIQLDRKSVV